MYLSMSAIWNFSPLLQSKLEQCLATASKVENSKWLEKFGSHKISTNTPDQEGRDTFLKENTCENPSPIIINDVEDLKEDANKTYKATITEIENICKSLDTDLSPRLDFISEECLKNPTLFAQLANNLPTTVTEKFFKYIFNHTNVERIFLAQFFEKFFPVYLKREYNCYTLEMLLQASKVYPAEFELLVKTIMKDLEIPSKVLHDYILTLNESQQTNFLLNLQNIDFTADEFTHNLFCIYTSYKSCKKTDKIQKYVLSLLYEHSNSCAVDKNFGRLLLTFLQTIKNEQGDVNFENLEKVIAIHRSPFKRPCLTIFNEIRKST